jgi:hypothetical protein
MSVDLALGSTDRAWGRGPSAATSGSDPLVWTPSAVRAELDRVRSVLELVQPDLLRARSLGKISEVEWRAWRRTYQTGLRLATRGSSLWGSNVVAARQHEQVALRWRELVKSRGVPLTGPEKLGRPPEENGGRWSLLLPALAGVTAAGILVYVTRK